MNWQHLQTFLWLRWRMSANQWRRGGAFNAILMMIIVVGVALTAVPLFIACLVGGYFFLPKASPMQLLYAWDVTALAFCLFWSIGVLAELQRTESLALSKFLHLPVSVKSAFLINYVSSLMRLTTILFIPVLVGLGLALIATRGPLTLLAAPLTAAFLLMVTGVTYQFQGWLASLMSNPRRRRTVIVLLTLLFVLIFQIPGMLSFWGVQQLPQGGRHTKEFSEQLRELHRAQQAGEIDAAEHQRRLDVAVQAHTTARDQADGELKARLEFICLWVNRALPIGWLPLGVKAAAEGNALPGLLGILGMSAIGSVSLWRAYRTTLAIYQGKPTSRQVVAKAPAIASPQRAPIASGKRRAMLLEARLPGVSEPVSTVALGSLTSMIRAPESKLMLLSPIILSFFFGSAAFKISRAVPDSARAFFAIVAIGMSLFGSIQLIANQFGFDRDGFRVFVLSAVPRRDILLGKNLAFLPLMLVMAGIMLATVAVMRPLRWDHLLSMIPQFVSMYLPFCILANLLSIYAPMHLASGSLKPSQAKLAPVLLQMAMMFLLFPLLEAPTLLPLGIETLLEWQGWSGGLPICLILSLLMATATIFVYRLALNWQGGLLQSREQLILETVTNRSP